MNHLPAPTLDQPALLWDGGSGYDLFMSLVVLHDPDRWGLRGSWAAGVRSRLAPEHRDFLRDAVSTILAPMSWLHSLPAPKDAQTVLDALTALDPADRLPTLSYLYTHDEWPDELRAVFRRVARERTWTEEDVKALHRRQREYGFDKPSCESMLYWHAHPEAFGAAIVPALQAYVEVFFAEEEARIRPYLQTALETAVALAADLPLIPLIEQLTGGVRYDPERFRARYDRVVLAPSYWATPLLVIGPTRQRQGHYLFGARPIGVSLVPGEPVPDDLYQLLRAFADPTRLRILRYLNRSPLNVSELAHLLRLRAPTVIHHLHALRLAHLVHVAVDKEGKRYTTRMAALDEALALLRDFLGSGNPDA